MVFSNCAEGRAPAISSPTIATSALRRATFVLRTRIHQLPAEIVRYSNVCSLPTGFLTCGSGSVKRHDAAISVL